MALDDADGRNEPLLGRSTCSWVGAASKASLIIDADEYFRAARLAMCKARKRIMLVGWDFDARIELDRPDTSGPPVEIASLLQWLVGRNPELEIFILRWRLGAWKSALNARTLMTLCRWIWHPRISISLDSSHPVGGSHHQKIVVIDDVLAFCGGIDMVGGRWDTPQHREGDPLRRLPNKRPYHPWHDATTALEGPVAAELGRLCRDRWSASGRAKLEPVDGASTCWPDNLDPIARDIRVGISRTVPSMPGRDPIIEIERLYLAMIASARRYIYVENQYLASRAIAVAIASRLESDDPPEIVLVNPVRAEGWLEPLAMDTARSRLHEALRRRDRLSRFRIYHPVNEAGTPIYVHAKIMIVDDEVVRIGSSNLNNRSMRLDTECDVTFDARSQQAQTEGSLPRLVLHSLLAEHLGVARSMVADAIASSGSLIGAIEQLRQPAGRSLRPYVEADLSSVEAFLAENELLDPEGPEEMFERLSKRGLFRGWSRHPRRRPPITAPRTRQRVDRPSKTF